MFRTLIRNYISGLLFGIFILILSVIPIGIGEKSSVLVFPGLDKLVHAGMYCLFTALLTNDYLRANGFKLKKLVLLLATVLAYSILIEIIQLVAPYRSGEILDALANLGGILLGASVVYFWRKFKY